MTRRTALAGGALLAGMWLALTSSTALAEPLFVLAERMHVGDGEVVADVVVVVEGGRIARIGARRDIAVPAGSRKLRAAEITPGFIDAHTSAGLSGLRNVPAVLDHDERTAPSTAALRAIDGFDPRDPLLRYLLEHGTTIVQTGPGPGNPIGGEAGIFRTHGQSADEMVLRFPSAMVFNLGDVPKAVHEAEGPSTRMGTAALIRQQLLSGAHHVKARRRWFRARPGPDLALAALGAVARGDLPAVFRARRADDILTALRLTREFGLRTAIAGASEGYLVRDALRAAAVPVFVGPVMERVSAPESENATYENAALLAAADVPIAIRSGYEAYVPKNRVLLFEAAIAAANGLGSGPALRAITLGPARLLDISADYGSLEAGKVADIVLFDGEPLEYTSHVTAVIAAGAIVFERSTASALP